LLYRRALAIREQALGPDHPSVSESLNNLGHVYYIQGKYAKAKPLYQRALAISEYVQVVATFKNWLFRNFDTAGEFVMKCGS
jgi:Tfp pilus assembly protein PilF